MVYLLILIVYVAIAIGIYKLVTRFTSKRWIKRLVIAFFILLPTYDIIITKALLFYYCNFTEKEKVYKTVENPESVYFEDAIPVLKPASKFDKEFIPKNYLQKKHSLESVELYNGQNSILHYELDSNGDIVTKELQKPTAHYHVYRRVLHVNGFIDSFLLTRNITIKDKSGQIIADLTTYNPKDYNIMIIKSGSTLLQGCKENIFRNELYILNYTGLKNKTKGATDGNK